jgi:hypothetical protein
VARAVGRLDNDYSGTVRRQQTPARRVWPFLLGLAGVAAVALSWTVPEPAPRPGRTAPFESLSHAECAQTTAPLNYGTRSVARVECLR